MSKKKAAKDAPELDLAQQETLPPPDPPKFKSEPTEPCEPTAVREEDQVGADPENPDAVFELDVLHHESVRGTGPQPEGQEPPPPVPEDKQEAKE